MRLPQHCQNHLMAVLHVVYYRVHKRDILAEWEASALFLGWVKVGVSGANDILLGLLGFQELHVGLNVGKLDTTLHNFGIVDDIGIAVHELEVAGQIVGGLHLVEPLAVDFSVCSGGAPQSDILEGAVELELLLLIVAQNDIPAVLVVRVWSRDLCFWRLVNGLREGLWSQNVVSKGFCVDFDRTLQISFTIPIHCFN